MSAGAPPAPSVAAAAGLYGAMFALALGLALGLEGRWVWRTEPAWVPPWATHGLAGAALLGALLGAVAVLASRLAARISAPLRRLEQTLQAAMRPGGAGWVVGLAACSSLGEEALFRGWLLPASGKASAWALSLVAGEGAHRLAPWMGLLASSALFGLAHLRPGQGAQAWPWMAAFWGLFLGAAFWGTGNLLAPALAHFTINLAGLWTLARRAPDQERA